MQAIVSVSISLAIKFAFFTKRKLCFKMLIVLYFGEKGIQNRERSYY